MNLQELKQKNPAEHISEAEKLGIENPSTLRKQEILFAILKKLAEYQTEYGVHVLPCGDKTSAWHMTSSIMKRVVEREADE